MFQVYGIASYGKDVTYARAQFHMQNNLMMFVFCSLDCRKFQVVAAVAFAPSHLF